ncbi:MAG: undecaprenyl-diphosphate phosphatase [Lachnospiraceae bacterium]|nr:undecaprenyl-diphosphate phosphatase [Lachnospiraceae bacterium]
MSILEAILLGLLQGLTEFLPVSSSGHLAIFQNLFHIGEGVDEMFLFDILLHLGTLISIFAVFYKDIGKMIVEAFRMIGEFFINLVCLIKKQPRKRIIRTGYRKFVIMIIISTIPTGIIAILIKDTVKAAGATLIMPGIFLLINAAMLFIAQTITAGNATPKEASYLHAAAIGVGQGFATLPGISRSGTTITSALLCGFGKKFAIKYSFIMSIPAVLGACVLEIGDAVEAGVSFEISYLVGMLVAAVVGYLALKLTMLVVKKRRYIYFSIYCAVIGLVAVVASFFVK